MMFREAEVFWLLRWFCKLIEDQASAVCKVDDSEENNEMLQLRMLPTHRAWERNGTPTAKDCFTFLVRQKFCVHNLPYCFRNTFEKHHVENTKQQAHFGKFWSWRVKILLCCYSLQYLSVSWDQDACDVNFYSNPTTEGALFILIKPHLLFAKRAVLFRQRHKLFYKETRKFEIAQKNIHSSKLQNWDFSKDIKHLWCFKPSLATTWGWRNPCKSSKTQIRCVCLLVSIFDTSSRGLFYRKSFSRSATNTLLCDAAFFKYGCKLW